MARLMAIDYGMKRCGIAVTDPLQMIARGLTTVAANELEAYLKSYFKTEEVEAVVFGKSINLEGEENPVHAAAKKFADRLQKAFPELKIYWEDERFTSKEAIQVLIKSGVPKMKRRNKSLLDEVSATLILQAYMEK